MQPTDKFRTDLDRAIRRGVDKGERDRAEELRSFFYRSFPGLTENLMAALFDTFLELRRADPERATTWLSGVGSLLFMDYDGTPFTNEEWAEIKEDFALDAEELDMDLLGYVMSLVVDHGAL